MIHRGKPIHRYIRNDRFCAHHFHSGADLGIMLDIGTRSVKT